MEDAAVMMIKKTTVTMVTISGPMTIDKIGEIQRGLLEAFQIGKRVELSLAGVTDIDLSGLQLLCSAHRSSMVRGLEFAVTGSDAGALYSVAMLAGMPRHIGCARDDADGCLWKREC
jgi:anti-anti-sigma regulatory factor